MTGAGISVSCGIPDFRSPKTGIYANLAEYNLPSPEAIFSIDYFKEKPEPFYKFMKSFDLRNFEASPTHYFIKMLNDKGLLHMCYTQNIDNLEVKTGIDMKKIIQAHGANRGAHCSVCKKEKSN
jgi:NAD-dependent SIR2 family protein deacetylase